MLTISIRKIFFTLCIVCGMACSEEAMADTPWSPTSPKHEVRAVWLTTIGGIDWPHSYAQSARSIEKQKGELRTILDQLQRAGINTVLLQTRVRATTIYPSRIEPWDGCLSGKPGTSPGYDALQFAINECHRRGMELHAWVVAIPVGKWDALGCKRLRAKHPKLVRKIGPDGFMDPEKAGTADYIADMCAEITRQYDVDGIHLDYIRYPETWNIKVSREQGRRHITGIVRKVSKRVKALKPWVKMSCSPIGKHDDLSRYSSNGWNAYTRVCQDAQGWLREGWMDALFPMMYFRNNQFFPFALDWAEESYGRIVAPGLGIYFLSPRQKDWPLDDITREMEVLRKQGLGHAYFRSKFFTDNTKGIYDFACQFDRTPALVPPMTWMHETPPQAPTQLQLLPVPNKGVYVLSWLPNDRDTVMIRYNVYASHAYPVDVQCASNLVATYLQRWQLLVPADSSRHYAVTAIDRYGNESAPLQQQGIEMTTDTYDYLCGAGNHALPSLIKHPMLWCNNEKVEIPKKIMLADVEYVTIENMYGRIVTTCSCRKAAAISIKHLPNGVYTLRSLGRKGVTHRLGWFIIKRK